MKTRFKSIIRRTLPGPFLSGGMNLSVLGDRDANEMVALAHSIDPVRYRFNIPVSDMRMMGALDYSDGHPFVGCLTKGAHVLAAYYDARQPSNLAAFYDIPIRGRVGETLPTWEVPWLYRQLRTAPPGENGLDATHGVSWHGPVSDEKQALEAERLFSTRKSILECGYDPDVHGDIEGYLLSDGARAVFVVRGGKHRAAALSALGYPTIPVSWRMTWPRVIFRNTVDYWPLVSSGAIDKKFALTIFDRYIEGMKF